MQIQIRNDSVVIEGYVNAIERNSKPLMSRMGKFIERICKGAFAKALTRNDEVYILLNHDWERVLGSTKKGNLKLSEDNIGLKARAEITDPEIVEKARRNDLVGWSFGFTDKDVETTFEHGLLTRMVRDLDLYEVSILDRKKSPAYEGTLVTVRSNDNDIQFRAEPFIDENITVEEKTEEPPQETQTDDTPTEETPQAETREEQPEQQSVEKIDYSEYDQIIQQMKGEI